MSPYKNIQQEDWKIVTQSLLDEHPLDEEEIVEIVLSCWKSIFDSSFGKKEFKVGQDILPKPQIMGFFLHELIPLELVGRYQDVWRGDEDSHDKDCEFKDDSKYSFEIKTSSNPKRIFGNRSYAQSSSTNKKSKDGYYLTVNFEKFTKVILNPEILIIRFGWIDSTDWVGQKAPTGQQARLPSEVYEGKLKTIYKRIKN